MGILRLICNIYALLLIKYTARIYFIIYESVVQFTSRTFDNNVINTHISIVQLLHLQRECSTDK